MVCVCESLGSVPDLIDELHPTKNGDLDPYKISVESGKTAWWVCKNHKTCDEHVWEQVIRHQCAASDVDGARINPDLFAHVILYTCIR